MAWDDSFLPFQHPLSLSMYFPRLVFSTLILEYLVFGERNVHTKCQRFSVWTWRRMWSLYWLRFLVIYNIPETNIQEVVFFEYIYFWSHFFFKYSSLLLLNNSALLKLLSTLPHPLPNVLISNLRHKLQLAKLQQLRWKMKSELLFSESKGGDNFYWCDSHSVFTLQSILFELNLFYFSLLLSSVTCEVPRVASGFAIWIGFLYSTELILTLDHAQPHILWVRRAVSLGVKLQWREANH